MPEVKGLAATFDTVTGVATLTWHPAKGKRVEDYVLYRNEDSPQAPAISPAVGHTRDTVFIDSVRTRPDEDRKVLYRIRARDIREEVGPGSEPARLHVAPQSLVRTAMTLLIPGEVNGDATVKDTLRPVLQFHNLTRKQARVEWSLEGIDSSARTTVLGSARGADTLTWVPDQPAVTRIHAVLTDEGGARWEASAPLVVHPYRTFGTFPEDLPYLAGEEIRLFVHGDRMFAHRYRYGVTESWEHDFLTNTWKTLAGGSHSQTMWTGSQWFRGGKVYLLGEEEAQGVDLWTPGSHRRSVICLELERNEANLEEVG